MGKENSADMQHICTNCPSIADAPIHHVVSVHGTDGKILRADRFNEM